MSSHQNSMYNGESVFRASPRAMPARYPAQVRRVPASQGRPRISRRPDQIWGQYNNYRANGVAISAIVHLAEFGLPSFTSGSVCIAPRLSVALLEALRRGDLKTAERLRAAFMPLEDCRDAYNPVRVLHDAVTLSGIADMGAVLPLLGNLEAAHHDKVRDAARLLLALNDRPLSESA